MCSPRSTMWPTSQTLSTARWAGAGGEDGGDDDSLLLDGRPYGLVVGQGGKGTTISSLVDGGHPLRRYCRQGSSGLKRTLITCRSYGENVVYTDWKKDNYFRAIKVVIYDITSQNLHKLYTFSKEKKIGIFDVKVKFRKESWCKK